MLHFTDLLSCLYLIKHQDPVANEAAESHGIVWKTIILGVLNISTTRKENKGRSEEGESSNAKFKPLRSRFHPLKSLFHPVKSRLLPGRCGMIVGCMKR